VTASCSFSGTSSTLPVAASRASASCRCSGSQWAPALIAAMPWSTRAGVFGITRTTGKTLTQNPPPTVALLSPAPDAANLPVPVTLDATAGLDEETEVTLDHRHVPIAATTGRPHTPQPQGTVAARPRGQKGRRRGPPPRAVVPDRRAQPAE